MIRDPNPLPPVDISTELGRTPISPRAPGMIGKRKRDPAGRSQDEEAPYMSPVCDDCRAPLMVGSKFCSECGSAVRRSCSACGSAVPAHAKFCPRCSQGVIPSEPPERGRRTWLPVESDESVTYTLTEWTPDLLADLAAELIAGDIDHRWTGVVLEVPRREEIRTDALLDDVERKGPPSATERDRERSGSVNSVEQVTYTLDNWTPDLLSEAAGRLKADGVEHAWHGVELAVPAHEAHRADAILDQLEPEETPIEGQAHAPVSQPWKRQLAGIVGVGLLVVGLWAVIAANRSKTSSPLKSCDDFNVATPSEQEKFAQDFIDRFDVGSPGADVLTGLIGVTCQGMPANRAGEDSLMFTTASAFDLARETRPDYYYISSTTGESDLRQCVNDASC